ncbi:MULTISPECIES: GTPase family protein [Enterobacter cloacae complex]|uniref:GTPase family protein n=1 Tax=Enterobacter cloacae complex TaxID=354276 RepID=UPI001F371F8D|nr:MULTISPECIES: GTPase [Enterobacter cloacae complex]ELD2091562.1 50S ribosome-binding GTPase [Enterobacter hormaechei]MCF2228624.1 50S ribosome-binding GTPase [Enterobacter cloacae]MCK7019062.1 50S ribosome-binding GTPase [Enterobacter kobei]MCQ4375374.1 50S ribosome-binding GTPase [Enterobacter kobei]MDV5404818.1 50S ribosome-binding GTPase [Enterobacter cloacae]
MSSYSNISKLALSVIQETNKRIKESNLSSKEDNIKNNSTSSSKNKILDDIFSKLPPEIAKYTKKKLTEVIDYEPRIGVMGKTGVGKSSLCNAIFQQDVCKVSHVEACTRTVEELRIDVGDRSLTLVDLPGVGESQERDDEYAALYAEQIPSLDLILWVIKADDRALGPDEKFYNDVIKKFDAEDKIIFVINQADKVEPSDEWNRDTNRPSSEQRESLERKEVDIYSRLFEPNNGCIAVSTKRKFNIDLLVKKMILKLPKRSKAAVYSTLREENKTEEVKKESKKGFTEAVKDVLDSVIDNAPLPKIVREPLKAAKNYICDKISGFFDSWF